MKNFRSQNLLGWPGLVWFVVMVGCPIFLTFIAALQSRGVYGGIDWTWGFHNFLRVFNPLYLNIFLTSFALASITSLLCLIIGFCVAWVIATLPKNIRFVMLVLVMTPFFLNLIVRIYAIRIFVGYDGPLLFLLRLLGVQVDPFAVSQNQWIVLYGMVTSYLPFMVFPLYAALEKFDYALIEANADLGGSHWSAVRHIFFPLLRPAMASGLLMVFVPALGEFVIPDLLGGAKSMLIGNLITEQFLKSRDWPFGSALTLILIIILAALAWIILLFGKKAYRGKI